MGILFIAGEVHTRRAFIKQRKSCRLLGPGEDGKGQQEAAGRPTFESSGGLLPAQEGRLGSERRELFEAHPGRAPIPSPLPINLLPSVGQEAMPLERRDESEIKEEKSSGDDYISTLGCEVCRTLGGCLA